jgi:hypothetical protein
MKLDLLANATVVNGVITSVSQKSKDNGNLQSPTSGDYKEGLNESDYNKHEDHAAEEQEEQQKK